MHSLQSSIDQFFRVFPPKIAFPREQKIDEMFMEPLPILTPCEQCGCPMSRGWIALSHQSFCEFFSSIICSSSFAESNPTVLEQLSKGKGKDNGIWVMYSPVVLVRRWQYLCRGLSSFYLLSSIAVSLVPYSVFVVVPMQGGYFEALKYLFSSSDNIENLFHLNRAPHNPPPLKSPCTKHMC